MVELDVQFTDFMDGLRTGRPFARGRLRVAPRFLVVLEPEPPRPHEPRPRPQTRRVPRFDLGGEVTAEGVADTRGRLVLVFDVDALWRAAAQQLDEEGNSPADVVGYLQWEARVPWGAFPPSRRVPVLESPSARRQIQVPVDPAKLMIGHTTSTTARIWFQLHAQPASGASFWAEVQQLGQPPRRVPVSFPSGEPRVRTISLDGLRPGAGHAVRLAGAIEGSDYLLAHGSFRTVPDDENRVSIGFASCHEPTDDPSINRWLAASHGEPDDLLILTGDQVYTDSVAALWPQDPWPTRYLKRYNQLFAYKPMRDVLRQTPTYMVFDDHEVFDDWGSMPLDDPARLAPALDAYRAFQDALNPPRADPNQFDFSFRRGAVAFYVLDERSHRGLEPVQNVLGTAQLARFRAWAASDEAQSADIIVVVSSVPLAYLPVDLIENVIDSLVSVAGIIAGALLGAFLVGGALVGGILGGFGADALYENELEQLSEPDVKDQWVWAANQRNLRDVLDTLFDLANDIHGGRPGNRPRAVIVLGGDIHVGAAHLLYSRRRGGVRDHGRNPLLLQLVSSPISHTTPDSSLLRSLCAQAGAQVRLADAELMKPAPDFSPDKMLGLRRFFLDRDLGKNYAAETLALLYERNIGRLVIQHAGGRRYQFSVGISGEEQALVTLFELDLDAQRILPRDLAGTVETIRGKPTFIRVNDPGTGYGPPGDRLDVEVVVGLDAAPDRGFGFQLRATNDEAAAYGMLRLLRSAFLNDRSVEIDYERAGPRNGRIIRVASP